MSEKFPTDPLSEAELDALRAKIDAAIDAGEDPFADVALPEALRVEAEELQAIDAWVRDAKLPELSVSIADKLDLDQELEPLDILADPFPEAEVRTIGSAPKVASASTAAAPAASAPATRHESREESSGSGWVFAVAAVALLGAGIFAFGALSSESDVAMSAPAALEEANGVRQTEVAPAAEPSFAPVEAEAEEELDFAESAPEMPAPGSQGFGEAQQRQEVGGLGATRGGAFPATNSAMRSGGLDDVVDADGLEGFRRDEAPARRRRARRPASMSSARGGSAGGSIARVNQMDEIFEQAIGREQSAPRAAAPRPVAPEPEMAVTEAAAAAPEDAEERAARPGLASSTLARRIRACTDATVSIRFRLDGAGAVRTVQQIDAPSEARACVSRELRRTAFPSFANQTRTLRFPQ